MRGPIKHGGDVPDCVQGLNPLRESLRKGAVRCIFKQGKREESSVGDSLEILFMSHGDKVRPDGEQPIGRTEKG